MELLCFPFLQHLDRLGGKAANLARLRAQGFQVPPFVVIPHDVLCALLPEGLSLDRHSEWINQVPMPETLVTEVCQALGTNGYFAVRSSGLMEDGAAHSFAGQFHTELFVPAAGLGAAVKKVWQSAFNERACAYAKERGIPWDGAMSIIIQQMMPATVSGVAFGVHPTEGWRDAVLVSAVYGLGEGLVSGDLNADTYLVRHGQIESTVADKTRAYYFDVSAGKVTPQPIESKLSREPALSTEQITALAQIVQRLNRLMGRPQDVEFAFVNNELYLLQTRPVTGLERLPDKSGRRMVWDNSNIIESYPGVTSPLTFSFIIKMYEAVYRQMGAIMGVPSRTLEREQAVFANMLGLLRGRVYYNLESWYRALAMLPGYKVNARYMETMMGVKERFDLPQTNTPGWLAWSQLIGSVCKMLGLFFGLPRARKKFKSTLDSIIEAYQAIDFDQMAPEVAMDRYIAFEQFLLKKWKAPLVNDFFAMICFGLLKKQCAQIAPSSNSLHNDLLAGSRDIISTEPFRRMLAMARLIHNNPALRDWMLASDPEPLWTDIDQFPELSELVRQFLQDFGERTVGELKLETITYTQNPAALMAILQSYARQALPNRPAADESVIRIQAEETVRKALAAAPIKRMLFAWLLRKTRELVSSRENLRYERTRGFAVVRRIFCGIGAQWAAENILDDPRDIFYLTQTEIFDFIKGTSVMPNLKVLVQLRKAAYTEFAAETPPAERITTYGAVYHANDFWPASVAQTPDAADHHQLQGLGCSAGIVRGRVRVVHDPKTLASLEGDILVTASTDPGWVTLFPSASAILVERGSLLSHSAIVSRELGIPCVVGVTGLLTRVKTGDWVVLDGATGQVVLLPENV